ncbi:MAG: DNA polymerase/3'-5' exonuclease PolX [Phycisphaeraceae bacterium]|nr:MAG: DNA polymerase/3'-5' exonuclease PolX [Phycisphaeraceae bacterium]
MSINDELAARFLAASRMLELLGEDHFRVNALARAARAIESLPADAADLAKDRKALTAVPGIGAKSADKITEFIATGAIAEFDEIKARVPPGLLDLMELPGLGPKTVAVFWNQAGVTSLDDLKRIIDDGSILSLPRMGAKSVEKIRQAIAFGQSASHRTALGLALPLAEHIAARLAKVRGVTRTAFAGSARRAKDTVGDLDILAASSDPDAVTRAFLDLPQVLQVLQSGPGKSSVRLALDTASSRWGRGSSESTAAIQCDLRIVPPDRFGAALMYFTGSKEHNVRLRERARAAGLTLNEYGLFHAPADEASKPDWSRKDPIAAHTEHEVFKALGLPDIPPEIREDAGELDLAEAPRLLELGDIRAELHAHTTASDGRLDIESLAARAKERGFHTIAVTDHSRSSPQAGGLSPERLLQHIEDIRKAAERVPGITILAGSEVDILADGSLDYDDSLLEQLDVVVASPHAALSQDEDAATIRLLAAVRHPLVHILGHPTGRLINRRKGLEPRLREILDAAAENHVALEINAHWMRLDLRDIHARQAMNAGCLLAVDCDVHEPEDFDNLRFGVATARRGWVSKDRCVNAWAAPKLHEWLASKRPHRPH